MTSTTICRFCNNPSLTMMEALLSGVPSSEICDSHKLELINELKQIAALKRKKGVSGN